MGRRALTLCKRTASLPLDWMWVSGFLLMEAENCYWTRTVSAHAKIGWNFNAANESSQISILNALTYQKNLVVIFFYLATPSSKLSSAVVSFTVASLQFSRVILCVLFVIAPEGYWLSSVYSLKDEIKAAKGCNSVTSNWLSSKTFSALRQEPSFALF